MTWESHVAEVTNDMTPTNKINIADLKMLFTTLSNIKIVINISLCKLCTRFVLQMMNLGNGMTQNQLKYYKSTKLDGWSKTACDAYTPTFATESYKVCGPIQDIIVKSTTSSQFPYQI